MGEPREGRAFFAEAAVFLADPDTLEVVGLDVPDFKKRLAEGKLGEWGRQLAPLLDSHPVMYIPSGEQAAQAQRGIARELASV